MRILGIGKSHGSSTKTKATGGATSPPQRQTQTLQRPSELGSAPPRVQAEGDQGSANVAPRRRISLGRFELVSHRPGKATDKTSPDEAPRPPSCLSKFSNWLPFKLRPSQNRPASSLDQPATGSSPAAANASTSAEQVGSSWTEASCRHRDCAPPLSADLSIKAVQSLPESPGGYPALQALEVSNCDLRQLPPEAARNLQELDISGNSSLKHLPQ